MTPGKGEGDVIKLVDLETLASPPGICGCRRLSEALKNQGEKPLAREGDAMLCPAVYPPDPTLGITDPQMLPPPKRLRRSRNYAHRPCPECGKSCPRDRVRTRTLHDLGDSLGGRPREIHLTYSQHHCTRCRHYFPADMSDLAAPKALYTHRVVALAVRLVVEDGLP
jgi:hypothetical protein